MQWASIWLLSSVYLLTLFASFETHAARVPWSWTTDTCFYAGCVEAPHVKIPSLHAVHNYFYQKTLTTYRQLRLWDRETRRQASKSPRRGCIFHPHIYTHPLSLVSCYHSDSGLNPLQLAQGSLLSTPQ